jgi:hypothetical protein
MVRANGPVVTAAWLVGGNSHDPIKPLTIANTAPNRRCRSRLEIKMGRNFSSPFSFSDRAKVAANYVRTQLAEFYLRLTGFACAFSAGSGSLSNSTILVARGRNAASWATAYSLASLFNTAKR